MLRVGAILAGVAGLGAGVWFLVKGGQKTRVTSECFNRGKRPPQEEEGEGLVLRPLECYGFGAGEIHFAAA